MKLYRIWALIKRYWYYFIYSYDRQTDVFYWPIIDMLLWGLTSSYFRSIGNPSGINIVFGIIAGLIFWQITWRGQYEVTVNLLEEIWRENIINIFGSPLKLSEWIMAILSIGMIKAVISFVFGSVVALILYKINLFSFGFYILPYWLVLIMSGWWIGFILSGLILRHTTRVQTLAWSGIYLLSPFSATFYPVSTLPVWAQKVASIVPMSYVFEGMREIINTGVFDMSKLLIALALNIVYLTAALIFFSLSFDKAMKNGLIKVV